MANVKRYLFLVTPIFFLLAEMISVFSHEYAHSIMAWAFGFKFNPFAIYYGHLNWQNIIFLSSIDEDVNYYLMYLFDHRALVGLTAFAGPGIATLSIFLISLILMSFNKVRKHPFLLYFIFWLYILNLSELGSYVFLRSFSSHGDMGHIVFGWDISPWWIFTIGGFLLIIALWCFFAKTIINLYFYMNLQGNAARAALLILSTFMLFGHPGIRMFLVSYGISTMVLATFFCITMIIVSIVCWPSRDWVKVRLQNMKSLSQPL